MKVNSGHKAVEQEGEGGSRATFDGRRTSLADLQSQTSRPGDEGEDTRFKHRLKRVWAACNDFLAGMYTGESCAGTPHSERPNPGNKHTAAESSAATKDKDPQQES